MMPVTPLTNNASLLSVGEVGGKEAGEVANIENIVRWSRRGGDSCVDAHHLAQRNS